MSNEPPEPVPSIPAPMVTLTAEHFAYVLSLARFGADRSGAPVLRNAHLDTIEREAQR